MIEYATFATALSALLIVLYAALAGFAFRRARRGHGEMELIAVHARRVEGPVFSALLIAAILLMASAVGIGATDSASISRVALGATRGVLLVVGVNLLGWYWTVRETWR